MEGFALVSVKLIYKFEYKDTSWEVFRLKDKVYRAYLRRLKIQIQSSTPEKIRSKIIKYVDNSNLLERV